MNVCKILSYLLLSLCMSSCAMYNYKFNSSVNSIQSMKGNFITGVQISDDQGNLLARFSPWEDEDKRTTFFNLTDFSPQSFCCQNGCPFKLLPDKIYLIDVYPKGDRMLRPVQIKVRADGSITAIKTKR